MHEDEFYDGTDCHKEDNQLHRDEQKIFDGFQQVIHDLMDITRFI